MADLPTSAQILTGGIVGAVLTGAGWLVNQFRSAANDGEDLADRRIASLTREFAEWRERQDAMGVAQRADMKALQSEVSDYRQELTAARRALRECDEKSHEQRLLIGQLRYEVEGLRVELAELRKDAL
jgi:chromosome segregation ATPase